MWKTSLHLVSAWLLAMLVSACASQRFEPLAPVEPSFALAPATGGPFPPLESAIAARHGPRASGFELLDSNRDALRWRLALLDSATRSIDIQYYLWYGDSSGLLLIERLLEAADRGVRVRLLLDDLSLLLRDAATVRLRDEGAVLLDSHPNIELRFFNPWSRRSLAGRAGEALTDIRRLNQRMHHKMLVVDSRAAIVGGRNIGDEYLGLNEDFNFHDLDVLGIGPVAREASAVFDVFWNSAWVVPASALTRTEAAGDGVRARQELQARLRQLPALQDVTVEWRDWAPELEALSRRMLVGHGRIVSDMPGEGVIAQDMLAFIHEFLAAAESELLVVNAYIIPRETGIDLLRRLTEAGGSVRILTNSLASHDVPAVNSHYKQRRRSLLAAGVELHEMRHDAAIKGEFADTAPVSAGFMGLHSKAVVADRTRSYIGSMNFDPRSAAINTEMGVVIDSPEMAQALAEVIERDMRPENSWQVQLDEDDRLRWVSSDAVVSRQPARNWWQRVQDAFFMLFPEELY